MSGTLECKQCLKKTYALFEGGICETCRRAWEKTVVGQNYIKKMQRIAKQIRDEENERIRKIRQLRQERGIKRGEN